MSFVIDASDCRSYLKKCEQALVSGAAEGLRQATVLSWYYATSSPLFNDRTGNLRNTISMQIDASAYRSTIQANAKYAIFVDGGTRPHMIAAKNGKALSFVWHGEQMFRRYVNHPGTKPRPFMTNTVKFGEQALLDILEKMSEAACN